MPPKETSPIEMILQDIERAVNARLYYLAIVMALTLPDICACLESPTGDTKGRSERAYKDWYNANLASKLSSLTDVDAYSLRCGVVHQGRFGHPKMQYDRMLFLLPGPIRGRNTRHQSSHDPNTWTCSYSAHYFCEDVIAAVREWYAKKRDDPHVQANLPRLVQYRPDGLMPFVKGMAVIA